MIVTTESGSKYRVDLDKKTWERVQITDKSGPVRTKCGSYNEIRLVIGDPMELLCPPFTKGSEGRYVETSNVISVVEE